MKYKLTFVTQIDFDTEDKFKIRDKYKEFNYICDRVDFISRASLYFQYSFEEVSRYFVKTDKQLKTKKLEYNNVADKGYYRKVPKGYKCFVLGTNFDGYFFSLEVYFLIKEQDVDINDFNNELYEKIAEYSLKNDARIELC